MGDNQEKVTVVCRVCGGKGGWPKSKNDAFDSNWAECIYCDSYGFIKKELEDFTERSFLLNYALYKKIIIEALSETICSVDSFTTEDMGNTIEIKITPYQKASFSEFAHYVLKIGYYSSKINIKITQDYSYSVKLQKYAYEWKITLQPDELSDLDGFVDVIKIWGKSKG